MTTVLEQPAVAAGDVIAVEIVGTRPLMISNAASAYARTAETKRLKELNALRKPTERDQEERDALKYRLALYIDNKGPYLPGHNLWAACRDAAAIHRQKSAWVRGAMVVEDKLPLHYKGPHDVNGLFNNSRFVDARPARASGKLILAVRPLFADWKLRASFVINDEAISISDAKRAIELAGSLIGLGTFRQRFGRFDVAFL